MTFEEMLAADKQNSAQKENGNHIKEATQTSVCNASEQELACMSNEDVKKILYQQLQLLAEKSKEVKADDRGSIGSLVDMSNAMCRLTDSYTALSGNLN